jgi:hypothetical protein
MYITDMFNEKRMLWIIKAFFDLRILINPLVSSNSSFQLLVRWSQETCILITQVELNPTTIQVRWRQRLTFRTNTLDLLWIYHSLMFCVLAVLCYIQWRSHGNYFSLWQSSIFTTMKQTCCTIIFTYVGQLRGAYVRHW